MRKKWSLLPIKSFWSNMVRLWWSVHGQGSRKCHGQRLEVNARDYVSINISCVLIKIAESSSAISCGGKLSQLWAAVATELRRGNRSLLLHLRTRGLGT